MPDPICRWRNPYINTVMELISLLPKYELSRQDARDIVIANSPYNFYKTPYQLACQLGLYYEVNEQYFPKFTSVPSEELVNRYLEDWIVHYCIPNPYTRGFDGIAPFSIHARICSILLVSESPILWITIKDEIFGEPIGNDDILVNSINQYSPVITINGGFVRLKDEREYADLSPYIDVDVSSDRANKEYFFDLFSLPTIQSDVLFSNNIVQEVNQQDIDLLDTVQNLPDLTQTEKNQIVAARIGQGFFRRSLILECGFCPITLVDDTKLLIASHIKPWRVSDNRERINPKNGILLTPTLDKLFDRGIISFTNERRLLISPSLSEENRLRLNLVENMVYERLPIIGRERFLEYHRDVIFIE